VPALVVGALGVGASCGGSVGEEEATPGAQAAPRADVSLDELEQFEDFPLYWVTETFDGLPLTRPSLITAETLAAEAAAQGPEAAPVSTMGEPKAPPGPSVFPEFVDLIYGDCEATSDSGCGTPLSIQIWRACNRSLDDYELAPGMPYPHEKLTVRGTSAALFEDDRVEVYAGSVTIVIFGADELAIRAAEALRPLNALAEQEVAAVANSTEGGDRLPPSSPGPDCLS